MAGCFTHGGGIGNNNNQPQPDSGVASDGQVSTDGQVVSDGAPLADAAVTEDGSAPGEGTISIYLTGDMTPKTFNDGLSGQTPTDYVIAISEHWAMTSLNDPSPALCFDTGPSPVEADLSTDTLVGVCQTASLPSAVYTHGRTKVEWVTYKVNGTLHYSGMPLAGTFTFFRAFSDTTYLGEPYLAGEGTVRFDGITTVEIPLAVDPPLSLPGVHTETVAGEFWMSFPYSQPLAVDQTNTQHHWARAHWEIFEGFRWQDDLQHALNQVGVWDVGVSVAETEAVLFPGVTGFHTTASTVMP